MKIQFIWPNFDCPLGLSIGTGLDVLRARAFGIYTDPKYSVTYPNGDEVQTFTIAFMVEEWRGTLRIDEDEVTALRFFPLEPCRLLLPHSRRDDRRPPQP